MNNDPLRDAKSGIKNAKRHIAELEKRVKIFFDGHPYASVIETNADGTEDFHKVKLTQPLPDDLADIAFDIVSNLRASLDRAGYAVAVAAGRKGADAHFPFGADLADAQLKAQRRSKDIPKGIFDLMISHKPYKGGDRLLWALNKLCNTNKHEILSVVGLASGGMHGLMTGGGSNVMMNIYLTNRWPPVWDSAKNEMTVFHVKHGVKPNMNVNIGMHVTLANIEGAESKSAVAVFGEIAGTVERILGAIDVEARRIGLFH